MLCSSAVDFRIAAGEARLRVQGSGLVDLVRTVVQRKVSSGQQPQALWASRHSSRGAAVGAALSDRWGPSFHPSSAGPLSTRYLAALPIPPRLKPSHTHDYALAIPLLDGSTCSKPLTHQQDVPAPVVPGLQSDGADGRSGPPAGRARGPSADGRVGM